MGEWGRDGGEGGQEGVGEVSVREGGKISDTLDRRRVCGLNLFIVQRMLGQRLPLHHDFV